MAQFNFRCSLHPYVANPGSHKGFTVARPWVEVHASIGGRTPQKVWCLVDTGSDQTILDRGTARALGLSPGRLPQRSVSLGNNMSASFGMQPGVKLDFAGTSVSVTVAFGVVAAPLLGRDALLNQPRSVVAGFDAKQWHHT